MSAALAGSNLYTLLTSGVKTCVDGAEADFAGTTEKRASKTGMSESNSGNLD
jgi:hypothetical protein